jgi:hypothetical protein
MRLSLSSFIKLICLALLLTACSADAPPVSYEVTPVSDEVNPLSEQQVVDIAWQALEPNTSSHDLAAWEVVDVRVVTGLEVQDLFEGEPVPGGCAPGPEAPDNAAITLDGPYWYVEMKARYATPQARPTEQYSPTAPPLVPEPFVYQARFLIDAGTSQVIARKIDCIIY